MPANALPEMCRTWFGNSTGQGFFPVGSREVFILFWGAGWGVRPVDPRHAVPLVFRAWDWILVHFIYEWDHVYTDQACVPCWFSNKTAIRSSLRASPTASAREGHVIRYLEKEFIFSRVELQENHTWPPFGPITHLCSCQLRLWPILWITF